MLDQILSTLKSQAAPALMHKIGLNEQQTHGSIHAAAESVKEVIGGGDGFGLDDVLNLFSQAKNTSAADGILSNIGQVMNSKLTGQVGLNTQQAGGVKDMLLPMITELVSKHVGGDANNLSGLLSGFTGNGGGIADMAKGLLGGFFK